jgi:hypothetical protein
MHAPSIIRAITLIPHWHKDPIYCLLFMSGAIALMTEAGKTSEMLANFYQIIWHNNPEDILTAMET